MRINHNIAALNTHRQLNAAATGQSKSMEKLSSGLRINRAGDDAAGLAISEKMRAQIKGLDMASKNAQDGISLIQTAEGALNETHSILQRMRELATQAANDTNVTVDRNEIQKEMNQLTSEINRIGNTTEFNTQKLLNGGEGQVGAGGGSQSFHQVAGTAAMDTDFSGETSKITIGDTTVTLDEDYGDVDSVVAALNAGFEGTGITFSKSASDELVISGAEGFTVEVDESDATTASISIATDTESSEQEVKYTVTGTAAMDTDFSGETSKITIGDTTVTLDEDYGDVDSVVAALNAGFEGTGITFSKSASDELVISGAEGFTVEVDETDVATASIKIATDTDATSNVPEGLNLTPAGGDGFSANFQVGANEGQSMSVTIKDMRAAALKISGEAGAAAGNGVFTTDNTVTNGTNNTTNEAALDVSTHQNASAAITVINDAIEAVSAQRSELGAYQNRLEHTINNLGTSSENLTAAESRIRDVDMAAEMMEQTKNSILSQAAQAMLAQSNQIPQGVLQLLR